MRHCVDDIFSLLDRGTAAGKRVAIVIPTNGMQCRNGQAVMGAGIAKAAAMRWKHLPAKLGAHLERNGNVPAVLGPGVLSFPTKHDWRDPADLSLIERSAHLLRELVRQYDFVFIPRVGAGLGKLRWSQVQVVLERSLGNDERFWVVSLPR